MGRKKRKKKARRNRLLPVLLLLAMLLLLFLGVLMVVRTMQGKSAIPPETRDMIYVITEPTTAPATFAPGAFPLAETTAPDPTEPTTEPLTDPVMETTEATPGEVTKISLSFYHAVMYLGDDPLVPVSFLEPADADNSNIFWTSTDETVASVDISGRITANGEGNCTIRAVPGGNPSLCAEISVSVLPADSYTEPAMSKPDDWTDVDYSDPTRPDIQVIGGCTYVQGILIVNKSYAMPAGREPGGMTPEASEAFAALRAAAQEEAGLYLFAHSDYRPYRNQAIIYSNYVVLDGQENADTFSARPGYSEHQTGMVIDVNFPGDSFNDTEEAIWLEQNCHRFGFVIRYPRGKDAYTGYKYESWHIRYVGEEWAALLYESGLSIEEYFHIPSVYPVEQEEE